MLLTQLRFAAMLHLSNQDYKALFALDIDSEEQRAATEQSRVEIYKKLQEKLPADVRDAFDELKDKVCDKESDMHAVPLVVHGEGRVCSLAAVGGLALEMGCSSSANRRGDGCMCC